MAETLVDFAKRRIVEIDKAAADLEASLLQLSAEKKELQLILDRSPLNKISATTSKSKRKSLTIKEMVEDILKDKPLGLSALDILSAINTKFEKRYKRTSLSPQLSRLKEDNILDKEGIAWRLAATRRQQ